MKVDGRVVRVHWASGPGRLRARGTCTMHSNSIDSRTRALAHAFSFTTKTNGSRWRSAHRQRQEACIVMRDGRLVAAVIGIGVG